MTFNGHLVKILHCCTEQAITEALEKLELTAAQGRVMGYLARCREPACPKDVEGFLYWYEGMNPHITAITPAA